MTKRIQRKVDTAKTIQKIFDSEDGKLFLYEMMKSTKFFSTTFDKDPMQMAFNEGARSVIVNLLDILKLDTAELLKQVKEQDKIDEKFYRDF